MTYFRLSRGPATEACQCPALDGCVHREWGVQVSSVADYKATCISCFHLGLISPLPSYIFILYTTFRFNIQGYPFRYHFFTSSAYFKMPGEKVRHIVSHPWITELLPLLTPVPALSTWSVQTWHLSPDCLQVQGRRCTVCIYLCLLSWRSLTSDQSKEVGWRARRSHWVYLHHHARLCVCLLFSATSIAIIDETPSVDMPADSISTFSNSPHIESAELDGKVTTQ